jgi:hypothetical protein
MHHVVQLDTYVGGSGNEVSSHSLARQKHTWVV